MALDRIPGKVKRAFKACRVVLSRHSFSDGGSVDEDGSAGSKAPSVSARITEGDIR